MDVTSFSDIQAEFIERIQRAVYCSVATVDAQGRPHSRVMHVVWDGATGWVITRPGSPKTRQIARNPAVSLAYIQDVQKPVYVDATAAVVEDVGEKRRVWELHRALPPPMGFDPQPHYGSIEHPLYGLLRFDAWRIELGNLGGEAVIWRSGPKAMG